MHGIPALDRELVARERGFHVPGQRLVPAGLGGDDGAADVGHGERGGDRGEELVFDGAGERGDAGSVGGRGLVRLGGLGVEGGGKDVQEGFEGGFGLESSGEGGIARNGRRCRAVEGCWCWGGGLGDGVRESQSGETEDEGSSEHFEDVDVERG